MCPILDPEHGFPLIYHSERIISHNNLYLASNDSIEDYYTSNKLEI